MKFVLLAIVASLSRVISPNEIENMNTRLKFDLNRLPEPDEVTVTAGDLTNSGFDASQGSSSLLPTNSEALHKRKSCEISQAGSNSSPLTTLTTTKKARGENSGQGATVVAAHLAAEIFSESPVSEPFQDGTVEDQLKLFLSYEGTEAIPQNRYEAKDWLEKLKAPVTRLVQILINLWRKNQYSRAMAIKSNIGGLETLQDELQLSATDGTFYSKKSIL